jgi:hypothetical protein
MTPPPPTDGTTGWVILDDGTPYSHAWLDTHTPTLLDAWQSAATDQQRQQLSEQIRQAAARAESQPFPPGPASHVVRIQWAETTRYEADLNLHPDSTDEQILDAIAELPEEARRPLDPSEADCHLLSMTDPAVGQDIRRDNHTNVPTGASDWGHLADSIDERFAQSWSWPALNQALTLAHAAGVDVTTDLPALAHSSPLPVHDPAGELMCRLWNSYEPTDQPTHADSPVTTLHPDTEPISIALQHTNAYEFTPAR